VRITGDADGSENPRQTIDNCSSAIDNLGIAYVRRPG
jgi:hypothetical protein